MINTTTALSAGTLRSNTQASIYRDRPLSTSDHAALPFFKSRVSRFVLPGNDLAEQALFATLAVLTLPMIAYCSTQLWSLLSGGSLDQAVRAFMP